MSRWRIKVGLFLPLTVITLMVHIIGFFMLEMELSGHGSPLVYLYVLVPLSIIVPLAILPFVQGGHHRPAVGKRIERRVRPVIRRSCVVL